MNFGKMTVLSNGNLQIKTIEHGELTLYRWRIAPLELMDIQEYKEDGKVHITLTDLAVLEDQEINEIKVSATIPSTLGSYSLIQGGWLPPNFGMIKSIVLADRNFISKLEGNFVGDKAKNTEVAEWFEDLKNFNVTMDILAYAMEGNKKRFQTKDEVFSQIDEAISKIRIAAPGVPIANYPIPIKDYAWNLLEYIKPSIQKRMDFLAMAASFIKPSSKKETILQRWKLITGAAKHYDLSTDIIHFLALISVSAPQKNSPGLGILKISPAYSTEIAYNACFDISLMELFMNIQRMDPCRKYTIITSDLALARLGGLLNDLNHKNSDGINSTFSARIPQYLVGDDPELHNELKKLISGNA